MSDNSETSEPAEVNSEREQLLQVARALDEATAEPSKSGKTDRLAAQIGDKTDQQLIDMLLAKPANWTPEALDAVREELKRRSLTKLDKQTDQQLLDILARPALWTPEAVAAAKVELKKRGVAFSTATSQGSQEVTQKSPTPSKPAVQVGLGAFAGGLILFAGIMVFSGQDPGGRAADIAIQALVGKILVIFGAMLLIGGIFVVFAERYAKKEVSAQTQNPSPEKICTPKWAYVFIVISFLVVILGGFIGALCGLACASSCIWLSRRQDVSLPRRIYGCSIAASMAWILYFVIVGIIFLHSS